LYWPFFKGSVHRHAVVKKPVPYALDPPVAFCGIDDGTEIKPSTVPDDPGPVYTYVEQMPTLNGQNALTASIAAITQYLVVPPAAPNGRVVVKFEVDKAGYVRHAEVVKSLRADLDSAVVTATRQLPRFTPGKQNGRVVRVSFILSVTIPVKKQP
jgi:TonB family protein